MSELPHERVGYVWFLTCGIGWSKDFSNQIDVSNNCKHLSDGRLQITVTESPARGVFLLGSAPTSFLQLRLGMSYVNEKQIAVMMTKNLLLTTLSLYKVVK